jgi:PKD repeat protein
VSDSLRSVLIFGAVLGVSLLPACLGPMERPVADFTWCPDGSEGRLDYAFVSTSTTVPGHSIVQLVWDFGDGSAPTEVYWEALHRFGAEGVYHINLTVTDSRGVSGTATKEVPVVLAAFVHPTWDLTLGWPVRVRGVVENRYEERLDAVVIRAKFYDADGIRLTEGRAEIGDLDPVEKAAFEVTATEFSSRIFYATVEVESFLAECAPFRGVIPLHAADR